MLTDPDLPDLWRGLGVPGCVDVHTHFLPGPVMDAVWGYFDRAQVEYGREWPIHYRWDEGRRVEHLRSMGVLRFAALAYAHRPGMARGLNDWSLEFADRTPGCLRCATFYPEPGVSDYVAAALAGRADLFKIHLQVGNFDPRAAVLAPVWDLLEESGVPVVVHCGSAPLPGRFTGPGPIGEIMDRHPGARIIVAHLGAPEFADFLALARRQSVWLDTTMALTDFMQAETPFPEVLVPELRALCRDGKVLFGSDYPNIPYPFAHQVAALLGAGLDDAELATVVWYAPQALLP